MFKTLLETVLLKEYLNPGKKVFVDAPEFFVGSGKDLMPYQVRGAAVVKRLGLKTAVIQLDKPYTWGKDAHIWEPVSTLTVGIEYLTPM